VITVSGAVADGETFGRGWGLGAARSTTFPVREKNPGVVEEAVFCVMWERALRRGPGSHQKKWGKCSFKRKI